jgi:hypothetical protein
LQAFGLSTVGDAMVGAARAFGLVTQKSVRIIGIDCPVMIHPKLSRVKSAAPPSDVTLVSLVETEPPTLHSRLGLRITVTFASSSMPLLSIFPTFRSCVFRNPSDGIWRALKSASSMLRL